MLRHWDVGFTLSATEQAFTDCLHVQVSSHSYRSLKAQLLILNTQKRKHYISLKDSMQHSYRFESVQGTTPCKDKARDPEGAE